MAQTVSQKDGLTHNLTDSLTNQQPYAHPRNETASHTLTDSLIDRQPVCESVCEGM